MRRFRYADSAEAVPRRPGHCDRDRDRDRDLCRFAYDPASLTSFASALRPATSYRQAWSLSPQRTTGRVWTHVALAAAIVIAVPGVRAGRPKPIEVGAVVTFMGFVVVAFLADASTAHWVARYARGIAALILSLISFASLFFTPFTEQSAREQVPEQYWGSPKFKEVNRKLTTMWACIFGAMVPFHPAR